MLTLRQSKKTRGHEGEKLPTVFQGLADLGAHLRRGQLTLLAAGPGTGKSALALTMALRSSVPTLYFSADSGEAVFRPRALSIATGRSLIETTRANEAEVMTPLDKALDDYPLRVLYDPSPSADMIDLNIESYEEVYGYYPSLIVIDNVTNVRTDKSSSEDDPFAGLESLMDYLHTVSRSTDAAVIGTHHVTGPYNDSNKPIPMSGVKGQITRVPEMVLTAHKGHDGWNDLLRVSPVKNRSGQSWPDGRMCAELVFDGSNMKITDKP